jgi:hypothetical protein
MSSKEPSKVSSEKPIERNILPLNIVKVQIDETLSKSETLLEAFDDNRSDTGKLGDCIENFKQLQGVFNLIEMQGASLLCEAMSKACEASLSQAEEDRDITLGKISGAIVLLVRYLEYVQLNQAGLPELLFSNINELRAVVKDKPLTESYFFKLDLKAFDLASIKTVEADNSSSRRLRHMYQVGLLGSFKEENLKSNFRMMARALERLNGLYQDAHGSPLLRICNGAIDALISGNISFNKTRKMMLGRIDRQVKQLLNPEAGALDEAAVVTLVKDCLYLIALAEPNTDLIKSIQEEFSLQKFNLNEALIQQERELMTGPSASVIKTVSSALREEIATIKDQLDVMARAGDKHEELKGLSGELKKVGHTLTMLGLSTASERLGVLIDSLENSESFEAAIQELADSLVFIERSIARLEQNNTPNQANAVEENPEQMLELDQVSTSVVVEARKIIAQVQSAISNFISNDFSLSYLENTVENLHSAWGGILFLNIGRAAEQLQQSANFISERILGTETDKDPENLHTLADALASIDYYLEGLQEKKPLGEGALDIAEESLLELGYGTAA